MTNDTGMGGAEFDHGLLSGYLDGELTIEERVEVEAQLVASPQLRAELEEVTVARAAVRGLPEREAPSGFWEAVRANVDAADAAEAVDDDTLSDDVAPVVAIEPRRSRHVRAGWIAGAAAVAAAIIAVILVPGRTSVRPNVTAVATQHGATASNVGDSISSLVPMGPLAGRR